ncbi:MAG: hypothetical protein ABIP94_04500, partial [Planctomycetota bacterium]
MKDRPTTIRAVLTRALAAALFATAVPTTTFAQDPADASSLASRIEQVTSAMPLRQAANRSHERLDEAHIARLEALLAELPAVLPEEAARAVHALVLRVAQQLLADSTPPRRRARFLAWCERLGSHANVPDSHRARLLAAKAEAHYAAANHDAAIAAFHDAIALVPNEVDFVNAVLGRTFSVELERQNYRAAKDALAAMQQPLEPLRQRLREAQLALRVGLFHSADRSLAIAAQLASERDENGAPVTDADRIQQLLYTSELALLRQDHDLAQELAVRLQNMPGVRPATANRARLFEWTARVRRGDHVDL